MRRKKRDGAAGETPAGSDIVTKRTFGMVDYGVLVDLLANGYFSKDGEYMPHVGRMNAMTMFFNECVDKGRYGVSEDITDMTEMEGIIGDAAFQEAFRAALADSLGSCGLTFGNAFRDAGRIVESRVRSMQYAMRPVLEAVSQISGTIAPMMTEDFFGSVAEIAKLARDGRLDADAIVKAYGESERFKEAAEGGGGDGGGEQAGTEQGDPGGNEKGHGKGGEADAG